MMASGRPPSAGAEDALRSETSLEFVPADAAFYRACLRNREQFDAVLHSNALQKLLERPRMAQWLARLKARWDDPNRSLIGRWLEKSENQELAQFALDALSHEVFWYGDASFADLLDLTAYVNEAAASAQLDSLRRGQSLPDSERAAAYAALRIVAEDPQELRVPPVVIGFRVSDPQRAERQIARIDELLQAILDKPPQATRREQIGGSEFLTWRLSGGMLPWDLIPQDELEKVDSQLRQRVLAVLESKNATLTVGLRGDYVLVSLGETNAHLETLGQGPLLIDRPELAPLAAVADRPLNTIVYVSEAYRQRAEAASRHQFAGSFLLEDFIKHPDGLAKGNAAVDEKLRKELIADMKLLTAQVSDAARARGATLRFSFLTPQGYEGYNYDWSQYPRLQTDEPLTVLNHLGGEPLGFFAMRRSFTAQEYDQAVNWLRRGVYYFEKIGLQEMTAQRRAAYLEMRRQLDPHLVRLDRTTRELLIPSIADGQKAIVLDATPRSETQFVERDSSDEESLPADALPGLELACVLGVNDSEKFRQACQEYLAVTADIWNGVRGFIEEAQSEADDKTDAPRLRIPELPEGDDLRPRRESTANGEIYFYELPARWKAADRVAPNMGLSQDVAVMSWLPAFSERLLEKQPLQVEGCLADAETPLAAAAHLNFAGIVDAVQPWLELASQRRQERLAAREEKRLETAAAAAATPRAVPSSRVPSSRAPSSRAPSSRAPEPAPVGQASPRAPQPRAVSPRIPTPPPAAQAPAPRAPVGASPHGPSARVPQPPQSPAAVSRAAEPRPTSTPPAVREPRVTPEEARERLQFTLDLLRCIRSLSLTAHQEGDALVTRYQIRIQDLK